VAFGNALNLALSSILRSLCNKSSFSCWRNTSSSLGLGHILDASRILNSKEFSLSTEFHYTCFSEMIVRISILIPGLFLRILSMHWSRLYAKEQEEYELVINNTELISASVMMAFSIMLKSAISDCTASSSDANAGLLHP